MKEYIEREALKRELAPYEENDFSQQMDVILAIVDAQPTADVVEMRHGRWVNENKNPVPWDECNSKCPSHSAYCSECGEWLTASDEYPVTGLYCPNCGALMDKEGEHGD